MGKQLILSIVLYLLNGTFIFGNPPIEKKENFHLYLMIGQSNMAGSAPLTALDTLTNVKILTLNRNNQWQVAQQPLRVDKAIEGLSPGIAFAEALLKADTHIVIGLIPCAVGGTSIELWKSDAYDEKTQLYPYDWTLERTRIALQSGVLKGVIWHQGESDSQQERAAHYQQRLETLIAQLRSDLQLPMLPFVAGLLPKFQQKKKPEGKTVRNPSVRKINRAILQLRRKTAHYAVVTQTKRAAHKGDWLHLDAASVREMGRQYAKTMIQLQNKN